MSAGAPENATTPGTDAGADASDASDDSDDSDAETPAAVAPADASGLTDSVWTALDQVEDLHVPVSLVQMGMIYGVDVDEAAGAVEVEMTFPCMGCPGYEMLQGDVRTRLSSVPGVDSVDVEVVWDPLWTKECLTDEAREYLTEYGIGL